jgi:hypothetical protein
METKISRECHMMRAVCMPALSHFRATSEYTMTPLRYRSRDCILPFAVCSVIRLPEAYFMYWCLTFLFIFSVYLFPDSLSIYFRSPFIGGFIFRSPLLNYFLTFPLSLYYLHLVTFIFYLHLSRLVISSSYFVPSFSPYFILSPFASEIAQRVQWQACGLDDLGISVRLPVEVDVCLYKICYRQPQLYNTI